MPGICGYINAYRMIFNHRLQCIYRSRSTILANNNSCYALVDCRNAGVFFQSPVVMTMAINKTRRKHIAVAINYGFICKWIKSRLHNSFIH